MSRSSAKRTGGAAIGGSRRSASRLGCFWAILIGAVIVLLGLIARLVRKPTA